MVTHPQAPLCMASEMLTAIKLSPGPKTGFALAAGWTLAPVLHFVETYLFDDWAFLASLAVVVGVDTLLGIWLGYRHGRLSSKSFARIFKKVTGYVLFLIAVHAAATHTVAGQANTLLSWLDTVAYSTVLSRELLSILEKTASLGLFTPPAGLVKRLEVLQTGKPTEPARATHPNAEGGSHAAD